MSTEQPHCDFSGRICCPRHASGPALLEALEELMHLSEIDGPREPGFTAREYRVWREAVVANARKLIAAAKGEN